MDPWLDEKGQSRGAVLGLEDTWALARAWYGGRLAPSWRGRSREESRKILEGLGLDGDFWRLD